MHFSHDSSADKSSFFLLKFFMQAYSTPFEDPQLRPEEKKLILNNSLQKEPVTAIPWGLILSKPPVWALIVSHFCHNWGTFILLTWMPTYYNQVQFQPSCCSGIY